MRILLTKLKHDEKIYPRNEIAPEHVSLLVDAIKAGATLPNMLVDKKNRVIDGVHRLHAYRRLKTKWATVTVSTAKTDAEIIAQAIAINRANGRPLDRHDIGNCVIRLDKYGYTIEAISSIVKIPIADIEKLTVEFAISPSGEKIQLKRGLEKWRGKQLTEKQMRFVDKAAGVNATFYVEQLIMAIENKVFPDTERFREGMDKLVAIWRKIKN